MVSAILSLTPSPTAHSRSSWRTSLSGASAGALSTLPQAVAFGLIAFAPLGPDWAAIGIATSLAAAVLFGLVTSLFGSNAILISGPRAVTAVVMAAALHTALQRGLDPVNALALTFLGVAFAGVLQALAGLLRLGALVSYLPIPVMNGFINASAVLVFLGGLSMLFPIQDSLSDASFWSTLIQAVKDGLDPQATAIVLTAVGVGGVTFVLTVILENRISLIPPTLLGVMAGTMVYYFGHDLGFLAGIDVIGAIPIQSAIHGPSPSDLYYVWRQFQAHPDIPLLSGLSIALLCLFDTVLASRALDLQYRQTSKTSRDLMLHGACNTVMGLLGLLPGSGTLVRSQSILGTGGGGRMSSVGSALLLLVFLVPLAPIVAILPVAVTAGLVMATAIPVLDRTLIRKLRLVFAKGIKYQYVFAEDLLVTLLVVFIAVTFDLIAAIGVGLLLAAALFLLSISRSPVRRVLRGHQVHSHVQRPTAHQVLLAQHGEAIGIIELQGALFFGSCAKFEATTRKLLADGCDTVILDLRHLSSMDSSGAILISQLSRHARDRGGAVLLSYIEPWKDEGPGEEEIQDRHRQASPRIWLTLSANGTIKAIGRENIYGDTDMALASCEDHILSELGASAHFTRRIAQSVVFKDMTRPQIAVLAQHARWHRFQVGDTVFQQGEPGETAYLLVHGRMEVSISIPGSARERRVGVFAAGTVFGEMGLLDGGLRSASITAAASSQCLSFDRFALELLQRTHPEVAMLLLRNTSRLFVERLRTANSMIAALER